MPEYFKERWRVDRIPDCDFEKLLGVVDADNVSITVHKVSYYTETLLYTSMSMVFKNRFSDYI